MGRSPLPARHLRRTDAVPAHVNLLGFGKLSAIGAPVDDLVGGKPLSLVKLGRLHHPQADVDDHVGCSLDREGDQAQLILGDDWRWRVGGAHVLGAAFRDRMRQ